VFGAGTGGTHGAYSACFGARVSFVVDSVPERFEGCGKDWRVAVDFSKVDSVEEIIKLNEGMLIDLLISRLPSLSPRRQERNAVLLCSRTVSRSLAYRWYRVPGLYVPADPGAPDANSGKGMLLISFGKLFEKVRST